MADSARYTWLKDELASLDHAYYVLDDPKLPDAEYDMLYRELLAIESEYPDWVTPDSPSQRVSGQASDLFSEVKHVVPMLSLNNALEDKEAEALVAKSGIGTSLFALSFGCKPNKSLPDNVKNP